MRRRWLIRCHRLLIPAALAALLYVTIVVGGTVAICQDASGAEVISLPPGETAIVTYGDLAFLVYAPPEGAAPVVLAIFEIHGPPIPPIPPPPGTVAGVFIIEEQADRTAAQARVMDDPVWQAAAKAAGLTWAIEDDDGKQAEPFLSAIKVPLPVVVSIDADGKPVSVVPLPATAEEMRTLIGGLK